MPSISRLKCFGRAFWGLVIFELHLWAINTGQAKVNSSPRGCTVLSHQCLNIPDDTKSIFQFHIFCTKNWTALLATVSDWCTMGARPDLPVLLSQIFLRRSRLSSSCPSGNFSMDRISDASLHAPPHHPTHLPTIHQGTPHISGPHLLLWRIYFGKGQPVSEVQTRTTLYYFCLNYHNQ